MLCYKDKCYCFASNKHFCKEQDVEYCKNKECYRHGSEIPDNLPEGLCVAWSYFYKDCKEYMAE